MRYIKVYDKSVSRYVPLCIPNRTFRKSAQRYFKQIPDCSLRAANLTVFCQDAYGKELGAALLSKIKAGCKPRLPMLSTRLDRKIANLAIRLQDRILDAPLKANGAYDLGAMYPGLEWHDLGDSPVTDSMREEFADEANCNAKVLRWARVPVTDENVFALYPPMEVFEFAARKV